MHPSLLEVWKPGDPKWRLLGDFLTRHKFDEFFLALAVTTESQNFTATSIFSSFINRNNNPTEFHALNPEYCQFYSSKSPFRSPQLVRNDHCLDRGLAILLLNLHRCEHCASLITESRAELIEVEGCARKSTRSETTALTVQWSKFATRIQPDVHDSSDYRIYSLRARFSNA